MSIYMELWRKRINLDENGKPVGAVAWPSMPFPECLFFWRLIEVSVEQAGQVKFKGAKLTDDALQAMDWIMRPCPPRDTVEFLTSFTACCEILSLAPQVEQAWLVDHIAHPSFETAEARARVEEMNCRPLEDDVEELFFAPRVVPERDQLGMFA